MPWITPAVFHLAVAQLVQVSLLVVAVAAVARLAARNRPHLAHVLWLAVLLKCAVPPLWGSPVGVFRWVPALALVGNEQDGQKGTFDDVVGVPSAADKPTVVISEDVEFQQISGPFPRGVANERPAGAAALAIPSPQLPAKPAESALRSRWRWLRPLAVCWLISTLVIGGVAAGRLGICWRRIRRARRQTPAALESLLNELAARLRVKRVRLLVTGSRVGPAVVGLLHPVLILPEAVVRGRRPEELEPILAHELLHVRRGDLWVGLLQVLVQAVWWFNPLVWYANRKLSREAERCCDEEVVAELSCPPKQYAQSLLDVLELKHTLRAVPTFPGVRPLDITRERMERIMKLGQGSRKRTPWWCWLALVVTCALALPGGGGVVAEANGGVADDVVAEVYDVGKILSRIEKESAVDETQVRDELVRILRASVDLQGESELRLECVNQRMIAVATPDVQRQIAARLKAFAESGIPRVRLECLVVAVAEKEIDRLHDHWILSRGDAAGTHAQPPILNKIPYVSRLFKNTGAEAWEVEQRRRPVRFALLDKPALKRFGEKLQALKDGQVLECPQVLTHSGRDANVHIGGQRPFVVGFADGDREVRYVDYGLSCQFRPVVRVDRDVRLDCRLELTQVKEVTASTVQTSPGATPIEVQQPRIASSVLQATADVPFEHGLLLGGVTQQIDGEEKAVLVLVTPKVMPIGATDADESSEGVLFGVGVNSDAGVVGWLQITDEKVQPASARVFANPVAQAEAAKSVQIHFLRPKRGRLPLQLIAQLEAGRPQELPVRREFKAGRTHQLKLGWPAPVSQRYHVTLEVAKADQRTRGYLAQNSVPMMFTEEDLHHAEHRGVLTKVVYLPDEPQQPGRIEPETIVSTRLDPGLDPVAEARRRGAPLVVMRLWGDGEKGRPAAPPAPIRDDPLDSKVKLHFEKARLEMVLNALSKQAGFELEIDEKGLNAAGVSVGKPVTIDVEGVRASNALALMLAPLGLGFEKVQEDPVARIRVTSVERLARNQLIVATYPVADLVVPVPDVRSSRKPAKPVPAQVDPEPLIEMIKAKIEPVSWSALGSGEEPGNGQIEFFETTLSLVIRQTQRVHERVADLLTQLRRVHDVQATIQCRVITIPEERMQSFVDDYKIPFDYDATAVQKYEQLMDAEAATRLLDGCQQHSQINLIAIPKLTLMNKQGAELTLPSTRKPPSDAEIRLLLASTVADDRRSVRLTLAVNAEDGLQALKRSHTAAIPDGDSLLIDVTEELDATRAAGVPVASRSRVFKRVPTQRFAPGRRVLLLLTPRVAVTEEEEQSSAGRNRKTSKSPFGGVVIIEEEEELLGLSAEP